MTLERLEIDFQPTELPGKARDYLEAVDPFIEKHRVDVAKDFRGFVPCDYPLAYQNLKAIRDSYLLCGDRFCEWGSGLGVVAALAKLAGFEAYGIEKDEVVAEAASELVERFSIDVDLVCGSFIPADAQWIVDNAYAANDGDLALHTESDDAYEMLGEDIDSFDLIFAFPWPNDLDLVRRLFEEYAADGTVLMTYNDRDLFQFHRKS